MKIESPVYVYVLKSEGHWRFYVGLSRNVERRLKEHNAGKTRSTRLYVPWQLVLKVECATMQEAREKEKWLKSGVGKEYVKRYWNEHGGE